MSRTRTAFEAKVASVESYQPRPYGAHSSDPEKTIVSDLGGSLKGLRRTGKVALATLVAGAALGHSGAANQADHVINEALRSGSQTGQVNTRNANLASQIHANEQSGQPIMDQPTAAQAQERAEQTQLDVPQS